jgi:hypothetical protein
MSTIQEYDELLKPAGSNFLHTLPHPVYSTYNLSIMRNTMPCFPSASVILRRIFCSIAQIAVGRILSCPALAATAGVCIVSLCAETRIAAATPPLEIPAVIAQESGTDVPQYLTIGPFTLQNDEEDRDYLEPIGLSEQTAIVDDFKAGLPKNSRLSEPNPCVDLNYTFGRSETKNKSGEVAYIAFEIRSERDTPAWLLAGSNGHAKVFVNGKAMPPFANKGKTGFFIYRDAMSIPLKQGSNLILIKSFRDGAPWCIRAHVSLCEKEALQTAVSSQLMLEKYILDRNIYFSPEDDVILKPRGAPPAVELEGHVESIDGVTRGVIKERKVLWNEETEVNGLYKIILRINEENHSERLLVGDPETSVTNVLKRLKAAGTGGKNQDDLAVAYKRMYELGREFVAIQKGRYRSGLPGDREWEHRFIQTLWMSEEMLLKLEKQETPYTHVPGLHLRGFTSRIDSSLQGYRIFVPSAYKDAPGGLPLAVFLPTVVSAAKPYLESAFIRDYDQTNRMAAAAERHKTIILWPGYHNQPTGSALESAHLGEVLEAVAKEYKFAEDRITLLGLCTGASMAFDVCANWPGRFAGIALLDPIFGLDKNIPKELRDQFRTSENFPKWFLSSGASNYLEKKSPAVFLINDGGEPGHGEIRRSMEFAANAANVQAPVEFHLRPCAETKHIGGLRELVQWASRQKLSGPAPAKFERRRVDNIQDALSERFIVIEGTAGTEEENAANSEITKAILDAWQRTHFSPCNVIKDRDASIQEIQHCNLVLIGNERTNSVWKSLHRKLDLQISPDAITLGNKTWKGDDISIQAVVPNPLNEKQKIILIGGWNPVPQSFGTLNLSNDGWFKCAIWKNANGKAILLDCASGE